MTYRIAAAVAAALMLGSVTAQAAEQKVTLVVHHADCVLCAPIVKGTLEKVTGVTDVSVSQPKAMSDVTANVTFDDNTTTVAKLIAASTDAGYPADVAR